MVDTVAAHPLVTLHWGARSPASPSPRTRRSIATSPRPTGARTLRAGWVVAADGEGRSRVREARRAAAPGLSYEGRYVIADIH